MNLCLNVAYWFIFVTKASEMNHLKHKTSLTMCSA